MTMKLIDILKCNRELGSQLTSDKYRIALISNIVIAQLKEILEFTLRKESINAEVTVGDYDAIVQDSVRFANFNAVIVFWETSNFVGDLYKKIELLSSEDLEALALRVESEMGLMLKNFERTSLVLINRFSSFVFNDGPLREGHLKKLSKRLNAQLENRVTSRQILIDLDMILAEVGMYAAVDFRQFQSSKALYSIEFFKVYAEAVRPVFLAATGRAKKVLVLDCDNTLWGGILGEDGEAGIQINDATSKGKAFHEVQIILKNLRKEGILLALCSKNNLSEVDKILYEHPDMVLKESDFVAKKVNWQDKATNLRELSADLNLGLDSLVFIDDSEFEIGLIRKELPQVKCFQVPKNLSEYPSVMRKIRQEFFRLSETEEDMRKTEMYRQECQRKKESTHFASIDEYLASLELKVNVFWQDEVSISRASQITQKTNQFNLTTRRYTEVDIQSMLDDPVYILAVFSVADRYGNYGVTGMTIIRQDKDFSNRAVIDSFLMSCRVIGRNVEYAFFDELVHELQERGINHLQAEYLATVKNNQVAFFYDSLGFTLIESNQQNRKYVCNLLDYRQKNIKYIEIEKRVQQHA